MAEIIGLVAELDNDRLLKTDLLGDAIESALSETGGTKDIGLQISECALRQLWPNATSGLRDALGRWRDATVMLGRLADEY